MNEQLSKKGTEINEYKEMHNIRVRGQDDIQKQEEPQDMKRSVAIKPIQV